jgi:hypothetical protein
MSTSSSDTHDIDIHSFPQLPASESEAQIFEFTKGSIIQSDPKFFFTVTNISSTPITISNIFISGGPETIELRLKPQEDGSDSNFSFSNGKILQPGESLPEFVLEGEIPSSTNFLIYIIKINFRASTTDNSGVTKINNFSSVWFRINPKDSKTSKVLISIIVIIVVVILLLIIGSIIIYFLIIRRKGYKKKNIKRIIK